MDSIEGAGIIRPSPYVEGMRLMWLIMPPLEELLGLGSIAVEAGGDYKTSKSAVWSVIFKIVAYSVTLSVIILVFAPLVI